ncbi:MAG TPA: hypothetical protein PKV80_27350 [Leptospiraceae bacterium]|nr:hypothetical protein [Leptospiraceae bacterium]
MPQALKIAITADKIDDVTNAVLMKDLVKVNEVSPRVYGDDGKEMKIDMAGGEKSIPLSDFPLVNFVHIEAFWAETDSGLGISAGTPAPFEYQINAGAWIQLKKGKLLMLGENNITALKVRNQNADGKFIRIRYVIGSSE